jgi:predicted acylesterase/phospholipase RssA
VVARRVENKNPVAIRDYTPAGEENHDQATIVEAALATSAASTFFPPVQIGACQYVDGALGSNNPVAILWKEAQDLWAPDDGQIKARLNCVLSIGTGRSSFKKVDTKVWGFLTKTLKDLVTETEETAQAFAFTHRDLIQPNQRRQYFR